MSLLQISAKVFFASGCEKRLQPAEFDKRDVIFLVHITAINIARAIQTR